MAKKKIHFFFYPNMRRKQTNLLERKKKDGLFIVCAQSAQNTRWDKERGREKKRALGWMAIDYRQNVCIFFVFCFFVFFKKDYVRSDNMSTPRGVHFSFFFFFLFFLLKISLCTIVY